MKTKSWKKYMCLMGISLMMMPAVCAMQTAEGGNGDNPVKKTRSTTFISGEKAWEPAGEGVTRQIMGYDGQVMLVKVKFEKGAIGTPHILTTIPKPLMWQVESLSLRWGMRRKR